MKTKKVEYIEVDYDVLEELIKKTYSLPDDYCIIAYNEWSNDSSYPLTAKKNNIDKYGRKELDGNSTSLRLLMDDMADQEIIEEGKYLVNVCW
jgi:hypothetical protein